MKIILGIIIFGAVHQIACIHQKDHSSLQYLNTSTLPTHTFVKVAHETANMNHIQPESTNFTLVDTTFRTHGKYAKTRQDSSKSYSGMTDKISKIIRRELTSASGRTLPTLFFMGFFGVIEFVLVGGLFIALFAPVVLALLTMVHFMFKSSLIMIG